MNPDDFEISTSLRAQRLEVHVPPDPETTAEDVALDGEKSATGLPEELEPGGRYEDVSVEKRLRGRQQPPTSNEPMRKPATTS